VERRLNKPAFLFAPGAGAPSSHPWMQGWKKRIEMAGMVMLFDYDYMREGRKRPDRLPQLVARHRQALAELREQTSDPIFLIGKSMGGRIGCHVALEEKVAGVICLGYPLCAGGDRSKLRDEVLRQLRTAILLVQGTRDHLCPLNLLEQVRAQMKTPNVLHVVESGDHSLRVPKRSGQAQEHVDQRILETITKFVQEHTAH
jgi:predicted alpha/beta-hydrolase family hydrolase